MRQLFKSRLVVILLKLEQMNSKNLSFQRPVTLLYATFEQNPVKKLRWRTTHWVKHIYRMKSVLNYVLQQSQKAAETPVAVMGGQRTVELYCPPMAINMKINSYQNENK